MSTLHVVFTPSGAGTLRQALGSLGSDDRVVCPFDSYAFGPINPPDAARRAKWVEDELGYSDWDDVTRRTEELWESALAEGDRKVAWFSRRSAQEYSGFLEWLWRLGEQRCEWIDLSEVVVTVPAGDGRPVRTQLALGLALLTARQIVDGGFIDHPETPTTTALDGYRETWRRLRAEDGPLRVLTPEGLVSAPITFFDPPLLNCATDRWQRTARIVGEVMANELRASMLQTGDLVLVSRIRALVEEGRLELRGDRLNIQRSEVRLPSRKT